jgi:hypothetical protein
VLVLDAQFLIGDEQGLSDGIDGRLEPVVVTPAGVPRKHQQPLAMLAKAVEKRRYLVGVRRAWRGHHDCRRCSSGT